MSCVGVAVERARFHSPGVRSRSSPHVCVRVGNFPYALAVDCARSRSLHTRFLVNLSTHTRPCIYLRRSACTSPFVVLSASDASLLTVGACEFGALSLLCCTHIRVFSSMGCSFFLTSSASSLHIVCTRSFPRRSRDHAVEPLQFAPLLFSSSSLRTERVVHAESPSSPTPAGPAAFVSSEGGSSDSSNAELLSDQCPSHIAFAESVASVVDAEALQKRMEKKMRRQSEKTAYLFAAVASTVGITFLAAGAVYYRFAWQTQGAEVPFSEVFATLSLAVGASVGMEFWARWAHEALWHDSLWSMHESHHRPRDGPFEMNDVFAIINAVPAIALMAYGFFHRGLVPGLCFGAGLGITVFGIAYMFVHDGLVHRRFAVGPIANVPYLQKVAAAHQLHHADKFKGVPFGLFLGLQELEAKGGGAEELEKMIQIRKKLLTSED